MRTVLSLLVLVAAFGLVACNDCDSCDDKPTQTDKPEGNAKAPTGAEGAEGETGDPTAECLCVQGLAGEPVWCKKCDKGYIDSEPAHCQGCVKKAQKKLAEAAKEAGGAE